MTECATPGCGNEKIVAKGLCMGCYHRARRSGSVERTYVVNTGTCSSDGCGEKSFAKNLCQKHYNQADDPMKRAWKNLRSRYPGQFPTSWDDFAAFMADVPPKPDGAGQLRRARPNEPWGKDNMKWMIPVDAPRKVAGVSRREYHSAYGRIWSDRTKYHVEPHERAAMLEAQGGACAICKRPETVRNPQCPDRKPRQLNIDHSHVTGQNRGLICVRCNSMIGKRGADDDPDILRAAADYLDFHHGRK